MMCWKISLLILEPVLSQVLMTHITADHLQSCLQDHQPVQPHPHYHRRRRQVKTESPQIKDHKIQQMVNTLNVKSHSQVLIFTQSYKAYFGDKAQVGTRPGWGQGPGGDKARVGTRSGCPILRVLLNLVPQSCAAHSL